MNSILLTLIIFIPTALIFFIIIPLFLRWFFVDRKLKGKEDIVVFFLSSKDIIRRTNNEKACSKETNETYP